MYSKSWLLCFCKADTLKVFSNIPEKYSLVEEWMNINMYKNINLTQTQSMCCCDLQAWKQQWMFLCASVFWIWWNLYSSNTLLPQQKSEQKSAVRLYTKSQLGDNRFHHGRSSIRRPTTGTCFAVQVVTLVQVCGCCTQLVFRSTGGGSRLSATSPRSSSSSAKAGRLKDSTLGSHSSVFRIRTLWFWLFLVVKRRTIFCHCF